MLNSWGLLVTPCWLLWSQFSERQFCMPTPFFSPLPLPLHQFFQKEREREKRGIVTKGKEVCLYDSDIPAKLSTQAKGSFWNPGLSYLLDIVWCFIRTLPYNVCPLFIDFGLDLQHKNKKKIDLHFVACSVLICICGCVSVSFDWATGIYMPLICAGLKTHHGSQCHVKCHPQPTPEASLFLSSIAFFPLISVPFLHFFQCFSLQLCAVFP